MSISYTVRNLLDPCFQYRPERPIGAPSRKVGRRSRQKVTGDALLYVAARLRLDGDGARLYDHDAEQPVAQFIILADPEACAALRAALPEPRDYLGDVLLLAHLGLGVDGPNLHTVYWIVLGELTEDATIWRAGPKVTVRPAPPGHE